MAGKHDQGVPIVLVDANRLHREAFKQLLQTTPFDVRAEYHSTAAALTDPVMPPQPGILVLRLTERHVNVDDIAQLSGAYPDLKVVLLGDSIPDRQVLLHAFHAGAAGFILSNISVEAFTHMLGLVMAGELVVPSRVLLKFLTTGTEIAHRPSPEDAQMLSPREAQVLRYLLDGHSNKGIARHLGLTEATVKLHLRTMLRKIGVENRTQAAIWAIRHGFERRTALRKRRQAAAAPPPGASDWRRKSALSRAGAFSSPPDPSPASQ